MKSYSIITKTLVFIIPFVLSACNNAKTNKSNEKKNTDALPSETILLEPICINYSESNFDDNSDGSYRAYSKIDKKYLKGKLPLSRKFLQENFFSGSDSVYITKIWNPDTIGVESLQEHISKTDYYQLDTVLREKEFSGVVFEFIQYEGSKKFLATFDKTGKIISRNTIATYLLAGTSTSDDGGRTPFWETTEGCIGKDLIITLNGGVDGPNKFQIYPDGRIKVVK